MKKIRIDLKSGRCRRFHLFDSVEALYIWLADETSLSQFIADNPDCVTNVDLHDDGQFLEIEWMGAEYTKSGTLHYVRIARATPHETKPGYHLAIYAGWIHNTYLLFNNAEDDDIVVRRIDEVGEIDIDHIFGSSEV